jgi:hypothetical protein
MVADKHSRTATTPSVCLTQDLGIRALPSGTAGASSTLGKRPSGKASVRQSVSAAVSVPGSHLQDLEALDLGALDGERDDVGRLGDQYGAEARSGGLRRCCRRTLIA